jgi:hypothetical protein
MVLVGVGVGVFLSCVRETNGALLCPCLMDPLLSQTHAPKIDHDIKLMNKLID